MTAAKRERSSEAMMMLTVWATSAESHELSPL
jgi:hypothetical protein